MIPPNSRVITANPAHNPTRLFLGLLEATVGAEVGVGIITVGWLSPAISCIPSIRQKLCVSSVVVEPHFGQTFISMERRTKPFYKFWYAVGYFCGRVVAQQFA